MATRLRIAAVGEVGLDRYVDHGRDMLGGCSCNVARAAASAGADAALFGAVGDDPNGRTVLAALARTHLALHVRTESGTTAIQPVRIDFNGERRFTGWEPGVVANYAPTEDELAVLDTFDVIALADTPAWDACLALGGPYKVADFSQDAETPWEFVGVDIAFVGGRASDLDRLRPLAGDALIVLTAGAAGAWAISADGVIHQPTVATQIIDTTGCGDAFMGAFTVAYFTQDDIAAALLAGSQAAARTAARLGA